MNLNDFNRVLRTTLLMPVVLLGILAGVLVWQIQEATTAQTRVAQAGEVLQKLATLQTYLADEESSLRAYQLTGNAQVLQTYRDADPRIIQIFADLSPRLAGPQQRLLLNEVRDGYALWQGYTAPALASKRASGKPAMDDLRGKTIMDDLRSHVAAIMQAEQVSRRELFTAAQKRIHDFLRIVLAAGFAVGVIIGTYTSSRLRRVSRAFEESLKQLKARADELYESRQSYITTLECIADGVIACDTLGRIRFMNAVAQRLTGWSENDALDRPLTEVFHAVHEKTRLPVERFTTPNDQNALDAPALLLARDHKERIISHSASPIRKPNGQALGIVLVFRDITQARHAEQALVANEKLAVSGRLAASIAHEIHNPLDSVASLHFLLRSEQDLQKREEYLGMAEQELSRILNISRAMLSLHRESQSPIDVELPALIDSLLLLLERRLRDRNINVTRTYRSSGNVLAFPGEIRQVFTNVLANATEACKDGGSITVTIRNADPTDGDRGSVVEITDDGPGIDPLIRDRLFQPFVTSKGERGTGLGLWVSLGIVRKHGGTMTIENTSSQTDGSQPQSGACVRIFLPEQFQASRDSIPVPIDQSPADPTPPSPDSAPVPAK